MRTGWILALALTLALGACGGPSQTAPSTSHTAPVPSTSSTPTARYDAALASRLGADDYGMAKYVIAFLKPGPKRDQSKEEVEPRARTLTRVHEPAIFTSPVHAIVDVNFRRYHPEAPQFVYRSKEVEGRGGGRSRAGVRPRAGAARR